MNAKQVARKARLLRKHIITQRRNRTAARVTSSSAVRTLQPFATSAASTSACAPKKGNEARHYLTTILTAKYSNIMSKGKENMKTDRKHTPKVVSNSQVNTGRLGTLVAQHTHALIAVQ